MKKIILGIIFVSSLVIFMLLVDVQIATFDIGFFEEKFEEYDIYEKTQIRKDNLIMVTEEMLDYLKGDREDLLIETEVDNETELVFGQRERAHMVDVKNLFQNGFLIRNISFLLMVLSFIVILKFHKKIIYKLLISASIIPIILMGVFGILISLDFNKYFTIFHEILFTNDLWLLNPETDILIQMLPLDFFYSISIRILTYFLLELGLILILGIILRKRRKTIDYNTL